MQPSRGYPRLSSSHERRIALKANIGAIRLQAKKIPAVETARKSIINHNHSAEAYFKGKPFPCSSNNLLKSSEPCVNPR